MLIKTKFLYERNVLGSRSKYFFSDSTKTCNFAAYCSDSIVSGTVHYHTAAVHRVHRDDALADGSAGQLRDLQVSGRRAHVSLSRRQ